MRIQYACTVRCEKSAECDTRATPHAPAADVGRARCVAAERSQVSHVSHPRATADGEGDT
jgi:hypothetical protein